MIVNYRLDKIAIQKKNKPKGPVEAKNNLKVINIIEETISSLSKEKALKMQFLFTVKYEPNIADIEIAGNVLYMNDQKTIKEISENWNKNKKNFYRTRIFTYFSINGCFKSVKRR